MTDYPAHIVARAETRLQGYPYDKNLWDEMCEALMETVPEPVDPDLLLANAVQAFIIRFGSRDVANSEEWECMEDALRALKMRPIPAPVSEEREAPKHERSETMKLGGGTANAMRAMGWVVRKPQDPNDCASWEVFHQHRPEQVWLAKDEAEGWQIAEREYHSQLVGKLTSKLAPIPAPVSEERLMEMAREVVATWLLASGSWETLALAGIKRGLAERGEGE